MKFFFVLLLILFLNDCPCIAQVKILFDATKAETAGSADWVIDSDQHNLGFSKGPAASGSGNESNPQRFPTPLQNTVYSNTVETYWQGGLSAWGIDCVKRGYEVETLPYNGAITYGDSLNTQDLSNYQVFIVCEPNIVFTSTEKTALLNFINNGGGLFMISDHNGSDRNNDGWDSPHIWNDLMSNNNVQTNPFGITYDYADFSETTTNVLTDINDSLLHGSMGNVTSAQWNDGTSMTLDTTINSTVKGIIFETTSTANSEEVMCAYARYGKGKVVAIGDSSPCDDGTGDPNDDLFNGYFDDASGNHERLLMNATIWLATLNVTSYTFTGNGDWSIAANWNNKIIPPLILPDGSQIIIDPQVDGQCILDGIETISKGGTLTIRAGKNFIIQGNLIIQSTN
jgi:hypothetical protein